MSSDHLLDAGAEALASRLGELTDADASTPCRVDPRPFTSERRQDRARAADACQACLALVPCARAALAFNATHWVWAGVDLVPHGVAGGRGDARRRLLELAAHPAHHHTPSNTHTPRQGVPTHESSEESR